MKIIDFECNGNAVRFALGADDCNDYWGDDWNDCPYEHNAGPVYEKYIKGYATVFIPFEYAVLTPESDWHYNCNSPFCKEDFKNRKAPCLVIVKRKYDYCYYEDLCYSISALWDDACKFYFEDKMNPGTYLLDWTPGDSINLRKIEN